MMHDETHDIVMQHLAEIICDCAAKQIPDHYVCAVILSQVVGMIRHCYGISDDGIHRMVTVVLNNYTAAEITQ